MSDMLNSPRPLVIGVGGFTSEVGKTTLLCELLKAFPGWEAIKTTRGHYRSCGKDPQACCVSHLLADEPLVQSDRKFTYSPGKDTGRYWEAGAANVHWVIATDEQIDKGIKLAVSRVKTEGVFIEGNSFSRYVTPDCFVMVSRAGQLKIKSTAKQVLDRVSAFYLSGDSSVEDVTLLSASRWFPKAHSLSIFRSSEFQQLTAEIHRQISSHAPQIPANQLKKQRILNVP
jgi:molybdopterin-guanine dinucleotide biosynthesis protein